VADRNGRTEAARLRGRPLSIARAAWLAVALLSVGLFVGAVPPYFAELQTACTRGVQFCAENRLLIPDAARELRARGISMSFYATYVVALSIVSAAV
jgi:hypothetical protein